MKGFEKQRRNNNNPDNKKDQNVSMYNETSINIVYIGHESYTYLFLFYLHISLFKIKIAS